MFEADPSRRTRRWPVLRVYQGHVVEGVLLSDRFLPVTTHWVQGKHHPKGATVLCPIDDCDLCELEPSRGLFYVAIGVGGSVYILELSGQSCAHLEQHLKLLHGGMKAGQVLRLKRAGKRQPVHCECVDFRENTGVVPLYDLAQRVMAVYRYPGPSPNETLECYESRVQNMARRRAVQHAIELKATPKQRV